MLPIGALFAGTGYLLHKEKNIHNKWKEIIENSRDLSQIKNMDCVTFFRATADHNGALAHRPRALFSALAEEGKVIPIIRDASSVGDITEALDTLRKQGNKVHSIFISAHGDANEILLSNKQLTYLDIKQAVQSKSFFGGYKKIMINGLDLDLDDSTLSTIPITPSDELIKYLQIDGRKSPKITKQTISALQESVNQLGNAPPINLISCSTGNDKEAEQGISIARALSKGLPGNPVMAPAESTSIAHISIYEQTVQTKGGEVPIPYNTDFSLWGSKAGIVFRQGEESSMSTVTPEASERLLREYQKSTRKNFLFFK